MRTFDIPGHESAGRAQSAIFSLINSMALALIDIACEVPDSLVTRAEPIYAEERAPEQSNQQTSGPAQPVTLSPVADALAQAQQATAKLRSRRQPENRYDFDAILAAMKPDGRTPKQIQRARAKFAAAFNLPAGDTAAQILLKIIKHAHQNPGSNVHEVLDIFLPKRGKKKGKAKRGKSKPSSRR